MSEPLSVVGEDAEINLAGQAKHLKDDPAYQLAFANVRATFMDELLKCPYRDKEAREYLWLSLKALDAIDVQLNSMIDTGKMAAIQKDTLHKQDTSEEEYTHGD